MNPQTNTAPQPSSFVPDWVANVKPTAVENEKQMTSSNTGLSDQQGYVAPKSSLISTSNQSQNLYNENVNKMNETSWNTPIYAPGSNTPTDTSKNNTTTTSTNTNTSDAGGDYYRQQYETATKGLDDGILSAKSTLDQARTTLQNDPVADAAVAAVMAKYDEQIRIMKDKNTLIAGNNARNGARYGSAQYATEMNNNFLSDQQDRASQRIADLVTQQTVAAQQVRTAYKTGDISAFNAAQKAFDDANKEKLDAINNLLKESHTVVKEQQADLKLKQTEQRNQLADDIKLTTNLGKSVVDQIVNAGITDEKKRKEYIAKVAAEYGIDNADLLDNAVVKAEQEATRQGLLNKVTQKNINKVTTQKGSTTTVKPYAGFTQKPSVKDTQKVNSYLAGLSGDTQKAIKDANANEALFYKVLNKANE